MLSTTLGGNQDSYSDHGIMGDINITLWPLQVRYKCITIMASYDYR